MSDDERQLMAFDAWGFLATAPHWIIYMAALLGLLLGAWWISYVSKQINKMVTHIELLDAMNHALRDHVRRTEQHLIDTDKIASEEHWKNCTISKCVHMQQFIHTLEKVNERFDQFDQRANETRANTVTSLEGLREGQRDLAREIGKELSDLAKQLINVLAENIRRK